MQAAPAEMEANAAGVRSDTERLPNTWYVFRDCILCVEVLIVQVW